MLQNDDVHQRSRQWKLSEIVKKTLFENAGSHPKNAGRKTTKNITGMDSKWR